MSNPTSFPDLPFYWPLLPAASIVGRVKCVVCVDSFDVSFSNYRPCLERYRVSPSSFSFDVTTKTAVKTAVKDISSKALPRQIAAA